MSAGRALARLLRGPYDRSRLALVEAHPASALCLAGVAGHLAHRLGVQGPTPAEVGELFPRLAPSRRGAVARRISAHNSKNETLVEILERRGVDSLTSSVDAAGARALAGAVGDRAAVLVTWHVGPLFALASALQRAGLSAFVVREGPFYSPPAGWTLAYTRGTLEERALALRLALQRLRDRGLVVAALDGAQGTTLEAGSCLGRRVVFGRGPLALARVSGAAVVPVVARWRGCRVGLVVGEPLEASPDPERLEADLARQAARWLEAYLVRSPDQIWISTLQRFLSAPRSAPSA